MRTAAGILAGIVIAAVGDNGIYTAVRQHCVKTVVYNGDVYNRSEVCLRCPEIPPCPPGVTYYPGPGWYAAPLWPFTRCMRGPGRLLSWPQEAADWRTYERLPISCILFDADGDGDVDMRDFAELANRSRS